MQCDSLFVLQSFVRQTRVCVAELVRLFVLILSKCSCVGCEMEASYMWDLLPQQVLTGEAAYYLTALFSAIHVLKHPQSLPRLASAGKIDDSCQPPGTLFGYQVGTCETMTVELLTRNSWNK